MKKRYSGLCSVLVTGLFLAALVVRIYAVLAVKDGAVNYVFYALCVCAAALLAVDGFGIKAYAKALTVEKNSTLNMAAYAAAAGFFADFVSQCYLIYQSVESGAYHMLAYFIPQCLICVTALICVMYFTAVAMSYHSGHYDFTALKWMHIAPLLWAAARMLGIIEQADSLQSHPERVLKYAALVFALCFFYCYARETGREKGAYRATVFFAGAFTFFGDLFFLDTLTEVLARQTAPLAPDSVLALVMLLLSGFVFFFERNIIKKTTENS